MTTTCIVHHLVAMQLFFHRPVAILLLLMLTCVVIWRGVVPAMSRVDSDFPNYLTAAKIVADRGDVDRLYDDVWFQEQVRHYRMNVGAGRKFEPFPPPTALLLVPVARLQPLDALRVLTAVSLLCLVAAIFVLAKILSWNLIDSSVFVLLSGYNIVGALRFGQPYILVSLTCLLGYYAYLRQRPVLAGMSFGLFAPIKYFPVVLLGYFAARRRWRLALSGAATVVIVILLSIDVLGLNIHRQFLSSVLGAHLTGELRMQDPFSASFQSFDSLYRRLFVYDATANPRPFLARPSLQIAAVVVTKTLLVLAAAAALVKLSRRGFAGSVAPSIGLLGILTLLIAPATASYHFVLLWLPVGLMVDYFIRERIPVGAYLVLGLYALIAFFPYRFTEPFEGRGALSVLAYPRLILMLAMFLVCLACIRAGRARVGDLGPA